MSCNAHATLDRVLDQYQRLVHRTVEAKERFWAYETLAGDRPLTKTEMRCQQQAEDDREDAERELKRFAREYPEAVAEWERRQAKETVPASWRHERPTSPSRISTPPLTSTND